PHRGRGLPAGPSGTRGPGHPGARGRRGTRPGAPGRGHVHLRGPRPGRDGTRRDLGRPRPLPGGRGGPHRRPAQVRRHGRACARSSAWPVTGYTRSFEPAMRLALAEAAAAGEDVPVGAVILDEAGPVGARARNRREVDRDPTAHAEILAIRQAAAALGSWRLTGLTLVVTLEPCTMCAGAVTVARLARVVYGAEDPKAGAAGSLWDVLRDTRLNHRPEVIGGVLAAECGDLLRDF